MSEAIEDTVRLDVTPGGAAIVTLNRPEKHNAFNADVVVRLDDIFETLRANADEARMVFLRGSGPSFSAGGDLQWMKAAVDWTHDDNLRDALALARMLKKLSTLPQLTCALVHGAAMGGGAGLVAACDMAVSVKDAKFRFSEVRLGLTPATISPFVVRAIGPRWAKALFATGEGFDGAFAHQIGLVQHLVDGADDLDDAMERVGGQVFKSAPGAVADAKRLVEHVMYTEIDEDLMRWTARAIAERRASDEGQEGLAAFLEKRPPAWIG